MSANRTRRRLGTLGLLALAAGLLAGCGNDNAIQQLAEKEGLLNPPPQAKAKLPFVETFKNNNWGWSLDPEWEIGPAIGAITGNFFEEPGTDSTPTADNGIAGVNIGGDYDVNGLHPSYYLTSPPLDASGVVGNLSFSFFRWLNSDYQPFIINTVDVFDGVGWVNLWSNGGLAINDGAWIPFNYDVTPFINPQLRVRFGFSITDPGVYPDGGWSVDDVAIVEF
jgi:hypothetical protein